MKKKLNISQCLQESEDSNSDFKILDLYNKRIKNECPTLTEPHHNTIRVLVSPKLTNTQTNSLQTNFPTLKTMEMQQKLIQMNYQTLICFVEDFLVSHSVLLEKGEVLKIPEAQCFLRLAEYLKLKDL